MQFEITKEQENQRVDRYIRRLYNNIAIPQSIIEKLIRNKDIKLNGVKTKSNEKINFNDKIEITKFADKILQNVEKENIQSDNKNKKLVQNIISKNIIYDDDAIFAIHKPHNIAVQGGSRQNIFIDLGLRNEERLVHRLDKETSGILLIAKNLKSAQNLTKQFKDREVKKIYLALVHGNMAKEFGTIKEIFKDEKNKEKTAISKYYELMKLGKNYSLVLLSPITGRKHQLRVHMNNNGTNIVGDDKYKFENVENNVIDTSFLYLCCIYLQFKHPAKNEQVTIFSNPDNIFVKNLQSLGMDKSLFAPEVIEEINFFTK